jgi:hypothetical protein
VTEGRSATVTGIVKRPYPTATDRRFAIAPRQTRDVALGAAATGAAAGSPGASAGPGSSATTPDGGSPGASGAPADVDLRDLAAHIGTRVRVGGLVTTLETDGFRLDDGTAIGRVVLADAAAPLLEVLEPSDALNAIGIPEQRDELVLVIGDAADVEVVGDLGVAAEADPADAMDVASADPDRTARAASLGQGMGVDAASAGVGTLALVTVLSVAVTLARRHRAQHVLRQRIVARLEAIGRGSDAGVEAAPPGPIAAQTMATAGDDTLAARLLRRKPPV